MSEEKSRAISIRIRVPFADEAEFINRYGKNLSAQGLFIATPHPRPLGVELAFEVVLASGERVLRGRGRVDQSGAVGEPPRQGMRLRFVRLDPESQAFVVRVVGSVDFERPEATEAAVRPTIPVAFDLGRVGEGMIHAFAEGRGSVVSVPTRVGAALERPAADGPAAPSTSPSADDLRVGPDGHWRWFSADGSDASLVETFASAIGEWERALSIGSLTLAVPVSWTPMQRATLAAAGDVAGLPSRIVGDLPAAAAARAESTGLVRGRYVVARIRPRAVDAAIVEVSGGDVSTAAVGTQTADVPSGATVLELVAALRSGARLSNQSLNEWLVLDGSEELSSAVRAGVGAGVGVERLSSADVARGAQLLADAIFHARKAATERRLHERTLQAIWVRAPSMPPTLAFSGQCAYPASHTVVLPAEATIIDTFVEEGGALRYLVSWSTESRAPFTTAVIDLDPDGTLHASALTADGDDQQLSALYRPGVDEPARPDARPPFQTEKLGFFDKLRRGSPDTTR